MQLDSGGLVTVGRREHGEAPSQAECVGYRAHYHDRGGAEPGNAGAVRPPAGLILERQRRRPQQILVGILGRHSARELLPAAARDEEAVSRGWLGSRRLGVVPHTRDARARSRGALCRRQASGCLPQLRHQSHSPSGTGNGITSWPWSPGCRAPREPGRTGGSGLGRWPTRCGKSRRCSTLWATAPARFLIAGISGHAHGRTGLWRLRLTMRPEHLIALE